MLVCLLIAVIVAILDAVTYLFHEGIRCKHFYSPDNKHIFKLSELEYTGNNLVNKIMKTDEVIVIYKKCSWCQEVQIIVIDKENVALPIDGKLLINQVEKLINIESQQHIDVKA